jgi:arylsulfatase A-like enzyme
MEGVRGVRSRVAAVLLVALVLASLAVTGAPSHAATTRAGATLRAAAAPVRPNIVLILTDDQRWDSLDELPATNARSWRRYSRSFVDDPMCCPSRASTLTGRLPNHTKVDSLLEGPRLDERRTFATMLHAAGYRTVFAGKYLNGYPFTRGPYTPPGWDQFFGFDLATTYYNYTLVENHKRVHYGEQPDDYSTDVLTSKVVSAIRDAKQGQPLLVEFAPNAPHRAGFFDPVPAPRNAGVCADTPFPLPANFNASDEVSEPAWMAGEVPKSAALAVRMRRATCETLRGVDESITAIFDALTKAGRLANTYIVVTSDNGYHFGEHRLLEKVDLYDESVRVPLLVRGPGVVVGADGRLTSNVDLAPTFLDWAHVTPPTGFFDGTSFAASARGAKAARPAAVVLRGCRTGGTPSTGNSACGGNPTNMGKNWGLRTARYKYVEYPGGYRQLFDVVHDPGEVRNLAPNPAYLTTLATLHKELVAMRAGGAATVKR